VSKILGEHDDSVTIASQIHSRPQSRTKGLNQSIFDNNKRVSQLKIEDTKKSASLAA